MPELPEVETIARSLRPLVLGKTVERVDLLFRPLLRAKSAGELEAVQGRRIAEIRRRGKMLVLEFEGGPALIFHLKMTGQFLWLGRGEPRDKHTRLVIGFRGDEREIRFRDVRKFGFLLCHMDPAVKPCPEIAALGPEPLEIGLSQFMERIGGRRGRIKSLLLNQGFIAGIGNIYADELLFGAKIHPRSEASALSKNDVRGIWESMRSVLSRAIAAKGTTLRDYTDAEGRVGEFRLEHKVYGREGEECVACATNVRRIVLGGRSTFFCSRCQKRRRRRKK